MADLRQNIGGHTQAGVVLSLANVLGDMIIYGVGPVYDIVHTMGRWGRGVFKIVLGFVLDFLDTRLQFLESIRFPARLYVAGITNLVEEAIGMVTGRGYAWITPDGQVKTDPQDTILAIYKQKGDTVTEAVPGSRTGGMGLKYVAIGSKRVYWFVAPYELPTPQPGQVMTVAKAQ